MDDSDSVTTERGSVTPGPAVITLMSSSRRGGLGSKVDVFFQTGRVQEPFDDISLFLLVSRPEPILLGYPARLS